MSRWTHEALLATASIGLWGVAWWLTADFPSQSASYVRFILAGLFLFSVAHLATAVLVPIRQRRRVGDKAPPEPSRPARANFRLVTAFVLSSCLYVVLIPWLGILTATALFGLPWLGRAFSWNWRPLVAVTALVALLYILLSVVLDVRMPDGLFI